MAVKECGVCKEYNSMQASICVKCGSSLINSKVIEIGERINLAHASKEFPCPVGLLYALAIIFPVVGIAVGSIYALSANTRKRELGGSLVALSLIALVISFAVILALN